MELRNWAGNIRFSTDRVHHPETVGQVQEIVHKSRQVRVLGSRHSFNAIADSTGDLISLDRLEPVLEVDAQRRQITIDGGVTYGRLAPRVHAAGFALHNTASLPHITVAGACATATHGSGSRNGILGSRVAAMEIVTADGTVRTMSRADDGDRFAGAVVGLGGLGVVTRLTLDVSPTFDMYQVVYENLPLAQVEEHFDAIMSSGYSVSLFTDWRESRFNQAWIKTVAASGEAASAAPTFYGATLATTDVHPLPTLDAGDLYAADGRGRPVARASAALPCGVRAELRRGAAERVLPAPRAGAGRAAGDRRTFAATWRRSCRCRRCGRSRRTACG